MDIPAIVKNFINSKESVKRRIELARSFSIPSDKSILITKTTNRLYDKEIGFNDLTPELIKTTGLPPDTIKKIVLELAGYEFLPVSDYLGDVTGFIKSLGGDPEKFPATRITIRSLAPEEVVSEVLHENTVNVPAHLDMRLRETLESLVRGVRTKDDTVHRLTRAEKIGGVGLADVDAEKIVTTLAEKASMVKINYSGAVPSSVAIPAMVETNPLPAPQAPSPRDGGGNEIVIAAPEPLRMPQTPPPPANPQPVRREINISETAIDFEKQLAAASVRVAGGAGVPVPKELNDRFMMIIAARLKDVRKSGETLEALKKPVVSGGMGLSGEAAQKTLALLEAELEKINASAAAALKKEKEGFVKRSGEETEKRESGRRTAETDSLDKLYGKLSGKAPAQMSPLKAMAGAIASPAAKVMSSAPPQSPPMPATQPAQKIAPVAPLPKMSDVRGVPRPRLMGPADELKNMNLTDFRRLSADPVVACQKLNDRLLLLEEQSYSDRVSGVKGWQDSPLNKLYLSILNESFSGAGGVSAVIRGRGAKGEETLTEAEVRAIMDFNRRLKN